MYTSVESVKLTDKFTVAVGDIVGRKELAAALSEARRAGQEVKVLKPGWGWSGWNCDRPHPSRLKIHLDERNKVIALIVGN